MKVAAYQAPLLADGATDALGLIREQIDRCESAGVEILCCPEAVLGGLADYAKQPAAAALDRDELNGVLAPLTSNTVTTILGFTETDRGGALYNSAAVFHRGSVIGVYRKLHPAINRSVYTAGDEMPVFSVSGLTFGIMICYDSNFPEPARVMASRGATALFVPTMSGSKPITWISTLRGRNSQGMTKATIPGNARNAVSARQNNPPDRVIRVLVTFAGACRSRPRRDRGSVAAPSPIRSLRDSRSRMIRTTAIGLFARRRRPESPSCDSRLPAQCRPDVHRR